MVILVIPSEQHSNFTPILGGERTIDYNVIDLFDLLNANIYCCMCESIRIAVDVSIVIQYKYVHAYAKKVSANIKYVNRF